RSRTISTHRPRLPRSTTGPAGRSVGPARMRARATSCGARPTPCSVSPCRPPAALGVAAAKKVPFELPRDRLAAGLRKFGGVAGLLEGPDVGRDFGIVMGEVIDPALPGLGLLEQLARGDRRVEHVFDALQERDRGLRARRLR